MRNHHPDPREAFTLLEVAMYIAVLSLLGIPLISIMLASTRSTAENDVFCKVEERNRTAHFRIENEFRKGMAATVTLANFGKDLIFTSTWGFDGTSAVAGPNIRFSFTVDAGETLNGADDDGDGLIDEGSLVRRDESTGNQTTICGGINVAGSSFALNGTGVTITVASFGTLPAGGNFSLLKSTTIYARN
jgi:type II secretory pathway pseudopilin PulG